MKPVTPRTVQDISGLAWTAIALASTAATTGILLVEPPIAIALIGGTVAAVLTYFAPEIVLAIVVTASLFGGNMAVVASGGYLIALASGAVASILLIIQHASSEQVRLLWVPVALLALLAVRYAFQSDLNSVIVIARCLAVLALVTFAVLRERDITRSLALAGIAFAICSAIFGQYDPIGERWAGVSGNPNRMVYGLLVLMPFTVQYFRRRAPLIAATIISIAIAGTLVLLVSSGSSQALAGIAIGFIALLYLALRKTGPAIRHIILPFAAAAIAAWLLFADHSAFLTDDIRTLSNRTSLYAAAWQDFLRNPAFGTGLRHVSDGTVVERSAHSSLLGLLASGGVFVGALWLAIVALLLRSTLILLRTGELVALVPLMLVTSQFVQSVELQISTWAIIGLFLMLPTTRPPHGTRIETSSARIGEP